MIAPHSCLRRIMVLQNFDAFQFCKGVLVTPWSNRSMVKIIKSTDNLYKTFQSINVALPSIDWSVVTLKATSNRVMHVGNKFFDWWGYSNNNKSRTFSPTFIYKTWLQSPQTKCIIFFIKILIIHNIIFRKSLGNCIIWTNRPTKWFDYYYIEKKTSLSHGNILQ